MAKVKGTSGGIISYQVTGIAETIRMLRARGKQIKSGSDLGVIRAASFIEEEVKDSIAGQRREKKSVDTGRLINSIEVKKVSDGVAIIQPARKKYPKGRATTRDVAAVLEFGTSRLSARKHFGNTKKRNEDKVREIIRNEII